MRQIPHHQALNMFFSIYNPTASLFFSQALTKLWKIVKKQNSNTITRSLEH